MSDIRDLDFIRSQLTIARWHLERTLSPQSDEQIDHLAEALRAYETAIDLLPTLKVSGTKRVELVSALAGLRDQLREAGAQV
jgi:hypothetical protein